MKGVWRFILCALPEIVLGQIVYTGEKMEIRYCGCPYRQIYKERDDR